MAKKRGRKRAKARRAQTIPVERGTEQTQRRLKRGTLQYMIEKGKIGSNGPEMRAAEEIAWIYAYITSAVNPMGAAWNLERVDRSRSVDTDPPWFEQAYTERYKPWANEVDQKVFDVVINIVWERHTANTVDKWYRWDWGTSSEILLWALRQYALKARWATRAESEDWSAFIYKKAIRKINTKGLTH